MAGRAQEVLAADVLGKLALGKVLQVNDVDRDGSPAQQLDGLLAGHRCGRAVLEDVRRAWKHKLIQ
jgi:hypothetical protein